MVGRGLLLTLLVAAAPGGAFGDALGGGVVPDGAVAVAAVTTKQISTGTYVLYSMRSTASPSVKLGYLIVTGASASSPLSPNTEHFVWLRGVTPWPANYYIHKEALGDVEALVADLPMETYSNDIECKRETKSAPRDKQWRASVERRLKRVGIASLIRIPDAKSLLGYWYTDATCTSITVGPDLWIDVQSTTTSNPTVANGAPAK